MTYTSRIFSALNHQRKKEHNGTQNTEHRTQNTEHRTQNTEHRTQNTEHRTQNTEHRTQNTAPARLRFGFFAACLTTISCASAEEQASLKVDTTTTKQELIGGTASTLAPEVGTIPGCTATLIGAHYALTASHCFDTVFGGGGVLLGVYTQATSKAINSTASFQIAGVGGAPPVNLTAQVRARAVSTAGSSSRPTTVPLTTWTLHSCG
jgi:hypothetical protein